jgi:CotH kinase protein/Bacterial Ig-like domain (group 3)
LSSKFTMFAIGGIALLALVPGRAALSQSFSLSASPQSLTIHPGDTNVPITVTASGSYSGQIQVTLTGLPSGITVTSPTLSSGTTATIYLTASRAADQEDFPIHDYNNVVSSPVRTLQVTGIAGAAQVKTPISLTVTLSNPTFTPDPASINLPVVQINTGGVAIVDKVTNVPGTISITSADGQTAYLPNSSDADNTGTFHLHGNTTTAFPKKAYHVKLNTSLDLLKTMGLNCPYVNTKGKAVCDKSKSYVLLANYDDKTFLRDWSASALANAIPMGNGYLSPPAGSPTPSGTSTLMPWAPHSLFVEVWLNGQYEGNYQLIEEVKADVNRVNISELSESDVSDDITGGYLMEIDTRQDEAFVWQTPQGVDIGLIDPDFTPDPEIPTQTAYISNYLDTAEDAMFSAQFTDPTAGWRAYYDEASLVNFYIVNDLMGNEDGGAFKSSDYLYKAIDNPLIYMGPVWDFDISAGNVNFEPILDPTVPWTQNSTWYKQLYKDAGFVRDLRAQWNALKNNGVLAAWLASIQSQSSALEQSQANNFGRWPMQGIEVWPNASAAGSYDAEVAYMQMWLTLRMDWMDSRLNYKKADSIALTVPSGALRNGSPATFSAQVTASPAPAGTVTFLANSVILGNSPVDGTGKATFTTANLPAGADQIEAVFSGDTVNAVAVSASKPVTVASSLISTVATLSAASSSLQAGTSASFTVAVVGNSGAVTPTGSVAIWSNGAAVGAAPLVNGVASFSSSALAAGTDSITATYSGDGTYATSLSGAVSVQVNKGTESVTLVAPASTTTAGSSVFLTVTVSGSGPVAAGQIRFYSDGAPMPYWGTVASTGTLIYPVTIAQGSHTITAFYSGDSSYPPMLSNGVTINSNAAKVLPAVTVTPTLNPAAPGASDTLSIAVSESVSGVVPTGVVQVFVNGVMYSQQTLDGTGHATYIRDAPTATGVYPITVVYKGDNNYLTATGNLNLTVSK